MTKHTGRPKALDLCCGAGGASMGLWQAGWEPIGVDSNPARLKRYPFTHHVADVADRDFPNTLKALCSLYEPQLIIAGPPCQGHSTTHTLRNRPVSRGQSEAHPPQDLIRLLRHLMAATGLPWIIENVPGAPLNLTHTLQLCGSSFGLRVRRHRCFEHSPDLPLIGLPCNHAWQDDLKQYTTHDGHETGVVQVFGTSSKGIGLRRPPNNTQSSTEIARIAMGIDWMSARDLSQAIPPAYTNFLGRQAMQHIESLGAPTLAPKLDPREDTSRNGHHRQEQTQLATGRKP